jgi:hypothetical protein
MSNLVIMIQEALGALCAWTREQDEHDGGDELEDVFSEPDHSILEIEVSRVEAVPTDYDDGPFSVAEIRASSGVNGARP